MSSRHVTYHAYSKRRQTYTVVCGLCKLLGSEIGIRRKTSENVAICQDLRTCKTCSKPKVVW